MQVYSHLKPGLDLSIRDLPLPARYRLAAVLDPADRSGRDWTALAAALSLSKDIMFRGDLVAESSNIDTPTDDSAVTSRLDAMLEAWCTQTDTATIRDLHAQLVKLDRADAVETLLSYAPLFQYT